MTKRIYDVNWDDTDYPEIEKCTTLPRALAPLMTFGEAKREIIEYFTHERDHAKNQIAKFRA